MFFNSTEFILCFLPITLIGLYLFGFSNLTKMAMVWLVLCSSFFYAWFSVRYLFLLWLLIGSNFYLGYQLSKINNLKKLKVIWLWVGISANLCILMYFKYTNFLIFNLNLISNSQFNSYNIILPLGISFFIFQKIGYLVDSYYGLVKEHDFLSFCLFVMFFPQLIAGPIVHHKEIIPQFYKVDLFRFASKNLSAGIILFTMGLIKKVCIADVLVKISDPVFLAAENGTILGMIESWRGALAFTFQIYFDFSGYTDMALGLGLMCGIKLPYNFNSPYAAKNIIDFWHRWHMSLSRFMKEYLYIPLGGNRYGSVRRYINLLLTMLIGGLWHGAAWTFVIWGGLHGFYLMINHGWQALFRQKRHKINKVISLCTSWMLTFFAVIVAWIFFRAESFNGAYVMLSGMSGVHGFLNNSIQIHFDIFKNICIFIALLCGILIVPNSQMIINILNSDCRIDEINSLFKFLFKNPKKILILNQGNSIVSGTLLGGSLGVIVLSILAYQTIHTETLHKFIYFQF